MRVLENTEPKQREAAAGLFHPWNDTARPWAADACVHHLVEAQARRAPHAVAIACGGRRLTYAELDARANQAARLLRRHGVGPDVLVGVLMERSPELIVAMLAVLKAGGAYVPLDPAYPRARVELMLADTRVPVLLTHPSLRDRIDPPEAKVVTLDGGWSAVEGESADPIDSGASPENLSHVIYTSGSTGTPKGVQIRHAGVATLIRWAPEALGIGPGTSVLASTSVCFDVHVAETWVPLSLGARIVLVPNALHLATLPEGETVEVASMVPSAVAELLRAGGIPPCVRSLNLGGEPLRNELAQALYALPGVERVLNLYGPTEDTTYSTFHVVERGSPRTMPVGLPIANTRVYLLDPDLHPVPHGEVGEVWIGGEGVSRGYLRRAAATAEKFVPDPFSPLPGARMYRAGDLGRAGDDGFIDCLGRVDHQVKVRGYRVELGEVEEALRRHPSVADAVADAREDTPGDRVLAAYVVADGAAPSPSALRAFVKERLPEYMVPSSVTVLGALPRLPNGKVDRHALPAPVPSAELEDGYVAPRTPTEEVVCRIWEEVLHAERVGAEDDFYELGGHSLRATQVTSRIRQAFGVELSLPTVFEARTPAELAKAIEGHTSEPDLDRPPLVRVDRNQPLPLSFSQQAIWFFQELSPGMRSYNFQAAIRFEGRLDADALARALTELVRRHEIFRTVFVSVDGEPRQIVRDPWPVHLPVADLTSIEDAAARQSELERLLRDEFQKPFHLGRLPLIRWTLYRTGESEHVLAAVEHHFVHDGWSFGVYLRELTALYTAYARGEESPLAEPEIQFADYAAWQHAWMRTPEAARQIDYWRRTLADPPPVLALRTDRPRPAEMSFRGRTRRYLLPPELARAARRFGRKRGVTLYMTLMAAFQALLHRYTGQADFCVGGGVANRNDRAVEGVIGMIVNTVAHRADFSGDPTVSELLDRVRATTFEAYVHREAPFGEVVEAVQPERRLSHLPIYQVAFSFQDVPYPSLELPDARMSVTEALSNESAKFDLQVIVLPRASQRMVEDDEVTMIWEYATDLFDDETVARMVEHYREILTGMLIRPDARVSELPLLSDEERRVLLKEWSGRDSAFPRTTIDRLFAEHAKASPDALALVAGSGREVELVSYGELEARANRLARHLRALGVEAGTRVGICLGRSPELIVATLAALKAGGAYVPLDPSYPAERLAFMLGDTAVPVLVTDSALADSLPPHHAPAVLVDRDADLIASRSADPIEADTDPESVAYVMYTSGSTGLPKGIEVPHRAVVRLVRETDFIDIRPSDVFLQMAPASFDASTLEIWGPLLNGARLALHPPGSPSVDGIERAVAEHGVTVLWLTAGLFHLVVEERIQALRGVRWLLAGGDVLSVPHVRRVLAELPGTALINGYGPTENTTFTCCHRVASLDEDASSVPIGRPIAGTRVYVLDERMQPVPVGVPGELYAGGAGLAHGYLDRPDLTQEKFVASPFIPGERLYRTGDRVCWRPDGTIEFLGRVDAQVKVRGFRIEPGEIEAALRAHPAVADALVLTREDRGQPKRLVAYVVTSSASSGSSDSADSPASSAPAGSADAADSIGPDELRAFLKARLPEYMVPSAMVRLDRLPLTPNGKVDTRALPAPETALAPASAEIGQGPGDETERVLAGLLASVLHADRVGVHDNFFALGGDSILCIQLVSRARDAGLRLTTRDVFVHQTVAALAAHLRDAETAESGSAESTETAPIAISLDAGELDELLYALERAGEGEPA